MNTEKTAPLEDLMVAMDVVDTLRHRQQMIDRELNAYVRRERLIEKLRGIYKGQGIEVTDQVLADGVRALEEDRFKYTAPEKTLSTRLAHFYITRDVWLRPLILLLVFILGLWLFYYFAEIRPTRIAQNALPEQLDQHYAEVLQITQDKEALSQALAIQTSGKRALKNQNYDAAQAAVDDMELILMQLNSAYQLRIVQQAGEPSGVWRIPDANTRARNFYLIIEAVDARGKVLMLPITSEETGKTKQVEQWGVRVEESVYQLVGADKKDDGIIQNRTIGKKQYGHMLPEYSIDTSGAAITQW